MPSDICKTCGRVTNSACSDYWDRWPGKDRGKITSCLAAWEDDRWVEGCGYATAEEGAKATVAKLLRNEEGVEMKKKLPTLAEVAVQVLQETDNPAVMTGDMILLDDICWRYADITGRKAILSDHLHPIMRRGRNDRHARVLNALERRPDLFEKSISAWNGPRKRKFTLRTDDCAKKEESS